MWPIPVLDHQFVSIDFSPEALVCSWMEISQNKSAPLVLRAYKRFSLQNLELEKLILFNPTIIRHSISSFLQEHNLSNAFVSFALQGPFLGEQFIAMPTSTPHVADFGSVHKARSLLWEYRYLYSNDQGQCIFYVYTIPRFIVLQYELLAITTQCNLINVMPRTMALLSAYKNIFGAAFRRSQLGLDMVRCNNNIEQLITIDSLNRMVNFAGTCNKSERIHYAAASGLFYSTKER